MNLDTRLRDMLLVCEGRRSRGEPVVPEEMCGDCPELLGELQRRLAELESLDAFLISQDTKQSNDSAPGLASTWFKGPRPAERPPGSSRPAMRFCRSLAGAAWGVVYKARQVGLKRLVALK